MIDRMNSSEDASDLQWLVDSRNDIQSFLLLLYEWRPQFDSSKSDFDVVRQKNWALLVGAAFSLWRSVFLLIEVDPEGIDSLSFGRNAEMFLIKVIKSNAIAFVDDLSNHRWSGRYYLNNARFRVRRMLSEYGLADEMAPGLYNVDLHHEWRVTLRSARAVLAKFIESGTLQ
jgi:hypothetical protein